MSTIKTSVYKMHYSLAPKQGFVVIEVPYSDRVALAAAWGLMASPRLSETYKVMRTQVAFRFTRKRYKEWGDIVKSCNEPIEK